VSGSAGLIIERAPDLPEALPAAGVAHSALAGHSQTLPSPPVRVRTFCPLAFVLAGSSRRVGGVNMQRPQRSVSGARTNDVDTDERRETIIDEGAGACSISVENGQ
jgi:hypothetical protein